MGRTRLGRRGAVAVITGITLAVLVGLAALVVDFGYAFVRRTALQSAADMAALTAAWQLPNATLAPVASRANQGLSDNGFAGAATGGSPSIGLYTPDPNLPPAARYAAGGKWNCGGMASNAVQIDGATATPVFLGSIFGRSAAYAPGVVATATRNVDAAFRVGSGLASVSQNSVLNAVLTQLLGTSINLTAVDYNNLLNANVNALGFANALATQLKLTAGTYSGLLGSTATVGQVIAAELAVLNTQGSVASTAISSLSKLQTQASIVGSPRLTLGQVLDFGTWDSQAIGSAAAPAAVFGTLNVYDLLSFAAQAANGSNAVAINQTVSLAGLGTLGMKVTVVEPPQPTYYSFGRPCTVAHTAQVRAELTFNVVNVSISPLLPLQVLVLPVVVEVAPGTATLTNMSCPTGAPGTTTATIFAQSGLATVSVGTSASQPASLLNILNVLSVTAFAQVRLLPNDPGTTMLFSFRPDQQGVTQTQSTSAAPGPAAISSTLSTGIAKTLQIKVLGGPLGLTVSSTPITNALAAVLGGTTPLLDSVLQSLLGALGISLGNVTVFALGARCGPPILVQ